MATVTQGWQASLSEPSSVFQIIYHSVQQPVPVVPGVQISWYLALSEPARPKGNNPQGGSVEAFPVAAKTATQGWQASLSEPSSVFQIIYQSVQQPVAVVAPISIGWFSPLSEPVRSVVNRQYEVLAYGYFTPTPLAVSFGWYAPLSDPTLPPKRLPPTEFAWGDFTPSIPSFGWFEALSEPTLPAKRTASTEFAWGDFTPPPPTVNFGWYAPLSTPTLPSGRTPPTEFAWGNFTPATPVVPVFGWYADFGLPNFTIKQRLSMDMAWGYFTPAPTPPPPPPVPPTIGSFSVGPQMITGQGSPPGEVYISPPKKGKRGQPKGTRIASDYPKWPGWGKY